LEPAVFLRLIVTTIAMDKHIRVLISAAAPVTLFSQPSEPLICLNSIIFIIAKY